MHNTACLRNLTVAPSQLSAVPFVKGCVSNICWELFPFYQLFFFQLPFFFFLINFFFPTQKCSECLERIPVLTSHFIVSGMWQGSVLHPISCLFLNIFSISVKYSILSVLPPGFVI